MKNASKNIVKILTLILSSIGVIVFFAVGMFFINHVSTDDNSSTVWADTSGSCGDNATYTLTDAGRLTISGTGAVTSTPWSASDVREVVVNDGITSICEYAFGFGCDNLEYVLIGNDVTSIGRNAFDGCWRLKEVNLQGHLEVLSQSVFEECTNLTTINIPSSVTSIEGYAFSECENLSSLTLPNGLLNIGTYAFKSCYSLATINIPAGVTSIGEGAFEGCINLVSDITIPNGVTSIERFTFDNCRNVTQVVIGNNVTSIGYMAFSFCHNLTTINIPASVISIDDTAFNDCECLSSIVVSADNTVYNDGNGSNKIIETSTGNVIVEGISYETSGTCGYNLTWTLSNEGVLTVSGTGQMDNMSFIENKKIKSVIISNGVTSIGGNAFTDCFNLESINISSSVTYIGQRAFYRCPKLTSLTFPDSVEYISQDAIEECQNLRSISFGAGLNEMWDAPFYNCPSLETVTVNNNNTFFNDGNGSNCIIQTATNTLFAGCKNTVIPNTVQTISNNAFRGCTGLTGINIPASVTSIGGGAFYGCTGLTNIVIPSSVTTISDYMFQNCKSLTSVRLQGDMVNIASRAFDGDVYAQIFFEKTTVPTIVMGCFGYNGSFIKKVFVPDSVVEDFKAARSNYAFLIYGYTPGTKYTITWKNDDGNVLEEDLVELGQLPVFNSASPTKSSTPEYSYEWMGWKTPVEVATRNTSYEANYLRNLATYTITYDANDESGNTLTQDVTYSESFTTYDNDAFSRNGYEIIGWSSDPNSQTGNYTDLNTAYDFDDTEDITLYVVWNTIGYTITTIVDGVNTVENYNVESANITLTNPTKIGYDFAGWTGTEVAEPSTTVTIFHGSIGNRVYTAHWTPISYTITYLLNDGTATNPANYTIESAEIKLNNPTKAGYNFLGWTGSNGENPNLEVIIPTGSHENLTFTANYEIINYHLIYNLNGGSGNISDSTNYHINDVVVLTTTVPTKTGYEFNGWKLGNQIVSQVTFEESNITVIAKWTAIVYTITTIVDGAESTQNYTIESSAISLINPTKAGYSFLGWTGANGDNPNTAVIVPTGSHENLTFTANFEIINYHLIYNLNGGNGNISDSTNYHINDVAILTTTQPTKTGYEFNGWKLGNQTVSQVTFGESNITVNADWTAIVYIITTIVDGIENTQNYTIESDDITLSAPTKDGYKFVGWTGTNGDEPEIEIVISNGSVGNKTYTANFEEVKGNSNLTLIIAIVISCVVLLAALVAIILTVKKKNKNNK